MKGGGGPLCIQPNGGSGRGGGTNMCWPIYETSVAIILLLYETGRILHCASCEKGN